MPLKNFFCLLYIVEIFEQFVRPVNIPSCMLALDLTHVETNWTEKEHNS